MDQEATVPAPDPGRKTWTQLLILFVYVCACVRAHACVCYCVCKADIHGIIFISRSLYVKNLNCFCPFPVSEITKNAKKKDLPCLLCLQFTLCDITEGASTSLGQTSSQVEAALLESSPFTRAVSSSLVPGQQREPVIPNPVSMTILFTLALPPPRRLDYSFSTCPSRVEVSSFKV